MDKEASDNWFSADRPISRREEDRLARRSFAEAIAAAVRGWRGRDSVVIAIHGPWGTGKSSIKNMVVEALKEEKKQPVTIAEFNPWQFGNRDQLAEAFFDEVGTALGRGTEGSQEQRRRILNRWRRYAGYLTASRKILALVRTPLAIVFAVAAVLVFGASVVNIRILGFFVGLAFLAAAAILHWSSRLARAVAQFLEVGVDVGRKSINEVKEELAQELRGLGFPLLIVIDDVDRLTPQETLEIFQLIKANGDLPNIMYLVLFERGAIEKNIEELLKVSGREYVEKIVQVGFDVPTIDRARLKRILFEGLDKALRVDELSERFDKTRWGNLFVGALDPYFETLRQVNRFLSTITFHVSLLRGSGVLEVNAIDLIGLEVLRVFEPDVYRGLPGCKEVLTSVRESNRSGQEQEQRRVLQSLMERTSIERQERVREIIKQLFPPAEWAFGGSRYASGFQERWYRELRVCSPEIFDRYFNFAIPQGDVSQAVIDRLRSLVGDRDGLRQELTSLRDQGLLEVVVDRLEAYKEELPIEQAEPFVTAVFDVGEDLSDDPPGMFEISPAMHALRIMYWFLRREPRPGERARILENAIRNTEGVSLPVRFVSLEEQAANDKDKARDRLLTDEALATLKRLCIEKLSAAAGNGTLAKARELVMILYRWQEWAGRDAPKAFCAELVHTPQGAVLVVEAFLQRSWSHTLGDRVGRERQYINLGVLENFVPWEQVDSALSGLDESSLTEKQRVAVAAFRTAVGRRRAGKPDLGSGRDDEED